MRKENVAVGGAVLTALGASLCCVGPVLALIFGVGALGVATAFASARPYLLAAAVLALSVRLLPSLLPARSLRDRGSVRDQAGQSCGPPGPVGRIDGGVGIRALALLRGDVRKASGR